MFKNYINITFRRLLKSKLYSSINIIGLALGVTCLLLAVLYWKDERSFDTFHVNNPYLYRITTTVAEHKGEKGETTGGTGQVQGAAFKAGVPEITAYARLLGGGISGDVIADEKALHLNLLFADDNFFSIFSFDFLRGNPVTSLKDVGSAVITEKTAMKFFNTVDVIGRSLQMDADPSAKRLGKPMIITGVIKDIPHNSSIQFDVLLPFKYIQLSFDDNAWLNAYLGTFVVIQPGADIKKVTEKFNAVAAIHAKEQVAEHVRSFGYAPQISYGLQPMTDIHLNPLHMSMESGVGNGSDPVFSYIFMGIAIFILLMAAINFINISIAGSLKRAKEVGIRKITGSNRSRIILQFLGESAMLCFFAFTAAMVLTGFSLPVFNALTDKNIEWTDAFTTNLTVFFIVILAAIILLTGLYPAYILSNFKPVLVLYNRQKTGGRNILGKGLVVMQFSLAIILLISTLVYYRQMNFISSKDLGYNPHQVIISNIPGDRDAKPIEQFFKNELSKEPSVQMLSFGGDLGSTYETKILEHSLNALYGVIDENYLPALQIPFVAGKNISADADQSVIVNEAFVKAAGMQNPIGTAVQLHQNFGETPRTIAGVVKDFHVGSLRENIQPLVMFTNNVYRGRILMKFEKSKQQEALAALERAYKKAMPEAVFQYKFMDEINAGRYAREQKWQKVISIATILALIICCLGLFGLAHLATHQRIKEIGVRKVLGASVSQIVLLLSNDFLKLIALGFLIAVPIAWFVMNKWLQDFAYRTNIGAGVFIIAGFVAIIAALTAISFQSIKSALANPVKALRTE
ncbi:MAG: ABC transporter permease [Agriterribacter sp.]